MMLKIDPVSKTTTRYSSIAEAAEKLIEEESKKGNPNKIGQSRGVAYAVGNAAAAGKGGKHHYCNYVWKLVDDEEGDENDEKEDIQEGDKNDEKEDVHDIMIEQPTSDSLNC
jgi:hypothetical protein